MLEPRRLAASSIAHHMASLLGEKTGETVGFRIRFETQVSALTRIEVVTEGILTRMLHEDNALEGVGLIIFDEFHERRIHTEVSLLLCCETQEVLRPELRLLVMSATMDSQQLSKLLVAPVVESQGRTFPVKIIHTENTEPYDIAASCARTIVQAAHAHEGDILAFLPGEGEIRQCEIALQAYRGLFDIHPLYGRLTHKEQRAAIVPHPEGNRKVVLATAIAETSLTIAGIRIVVDTGYARTHTYEAASGLSRLKTVRVSQDMADQRAGRAGRLSPGVCYRMWTAATHLQLAPFRKPEVLDADLTPTVLDFAQWGISDIRSLQWLTPPPAGPLAQATEALEALGALVNGKITPHGKRLNRLPCHPRIAHMLLKSQSDGNSPTLANLATDIAALLDERDPLQNPHSVDIDLRIEALRRHRKQNHLERGWDNIERVARSYRKLIGARTDNHAPQSYLSGMLLAYAYPGQIAQLQPGGNGLFKLANGRTAKIDISDPLAHEAWISIAQMDARSGAGKIFLAAAVDISDLKEFIHNDTVIAWNTQHQEMTAAAITRLGNIRITERSLTKPNADKLLVAWHDALRQDGERLLHFDDETKQLQNRMACLTAWHPTESWPDLSTPTLLANPERWITPYLSGITKADQLRQLHLGDIIYHSLLHEQQQKLDTLAPSHFEVPSGSRIRVQYDGRTGLATLSVRLQELFGLQQTPKINNGRTPLIISLLSPGFKPVQTTSDLESFWNTTYFEVRKELKRRYPKHAWPDNPLIASPIKGVPRRTKA